MNPYLYWSLVNAKWFNIYRFMIFTFIAWCICKLDRESQFLWCFCISFHKMGTLRYWPLTCSNIFISMLDWDNQKWSIALYSIYFWVSILFFVYCCILWSKSYLMSKSKFAIFHSIKWVRLLFPLISLLLFRLCRRWIELISNGISNKEIVLRIYLIFNKCSPIYM